jgi:hypothetical protein
MHAPQRFADWLSTNIANDKKYGRKVFRYHPRSDQHSKRISTLVANDLLEHCPALRQHAADGHAVGRTNIEYTFPNGKSKTLDLAIGEPIGPISEALFPDTIPTGDIGELRIACEAKQCMTEHMKTKPRIYDELSSSHEIVHQGDTNVIAAGIVVVNIAVQFASPTRQVSGDGPLIITKHRQPRVATSIVDHLKGLVMRQAVGQVGFDALAIIVIDCDNCGPCTLHVGPPAPQPGDPHHYETFISRMADFYTRRFG